ncbi:DUF4309 domain-containing protein [Paenibacillus piri]|uniref:DUF4309 domain-containing protein n=1 Tax=Paenibacillus piri TaxID=2547395 RepID=A0A4R5KMP9_9BACL|nr:DUF4309 domain-containing protein [Paenibacillus piri]TDF95897.1 DUF4309 domain-containing protein [Paenibacillus piri]
MIRETRYVALWSVPFIFIMLITGCNHAPNVAMQGTAPGHTPVVADVPADPVNKQVSPPTVIPAEKEPAAVNPNDKVSLASAPHDNTPEDAAAADGKPAQPAKPKIDIQDPFNQAKPTLLGLTLKSTVETVTAKYGKPKEQFVMDDDSDPITVYDYTDFLVGFNKSNLLQFIDIRSSEINPGLNGLKLGQSTNDAYKALGKPDSNTSFVLTYKSTGAVLKLDIDPKSDKVNSIKLFAVE